MAATEPTLARGAIGLREVLFQSVTSMAPAGAVALSIAAGATYAGGALPLAVLLALVACLLVASSIGQLAKHLPSAGSIYTLAIGLPIGIHFGPTTAFIFLATILTGIMIAIYMVFNLSCIMFYRRRRPEEFNVLLHAVIPVLGILAFIPAWLTALGLGSSFLKFVTPLSYPSSETGLAIGIWYIIGIVVLVYLYLRHPARLPEMRRVFADEELPPAAGEPVTSGEAA
jgi:amino acid transporter